MCKVQQQEIKKIRRANPTVTKAESDQPLRLESALLTSVPCGNT